MWPGTALLAFMAPGACPGSFDKGSPSGALTCAAFTPYDRREYNRFKHLHCAAWSFLDHCFICVNHVIYFIRARLGRKRRVVTVASPCLHQGGGIGINHWQDVAAQWHLNSSIFSSLFTPLQTLKMLQILHSCTSHCSRHSICAAAAWIACPCAIYCTLIFNVKLPLNLGLLHLVWMPHWGGMKHEHERLRTHTTY